MLSRIGLVLCAAIVAGPAPGAPQVPADNQIDVLKVSELEAGFHLLYELKPAESHLQFESWEKSHPEDPLGGAAQAAGYLFEECFRQGVLTSAFFLDNKRFLGNVGVTPDPALRAAFFAADQRAQDLARPRL